MNAPPDDVNVRWLKVVLDDLGYRAKSSKSTNRTGDKGKRSRPSLHSDRAGSMLLTLSGSEVGAAISASIGGQYQGSTLATSCSITEI